MLGWEFPPHLSGGLGTACQGLTRGLAAAGVELTFVVPRLYGGELAPWMNLVAAGEGERSTAPSDEALPSPPSVAPPAPASYRLLALPAALSPYAAPGAGCAPEASAALAALPGWERGAPPADSGEWRLLAEGVAGAAARGATAPAPFRGGYGGDLLAEVARYALAAAELARRESWDLVHAHDWMTFPAGLAAARAAGVPLVCHLHASEDDRSPLRPDERVVEVERLGLTAADAVVCVSAYTAAHVRRRYGVPAERLHVVHNAVDPLSPRDAASDGAPAAGRAAEAPLVLFLGRVTAQKGPEYFLEAAAKVHAVRPQVRFVVAGHGDLWPWMVERSAELGLSRNLFFTGFLRAPEVARLYAQADVYVMPSVSEPFGIAPLEALAAQVPVIVSRQSGVAEVLENALKVDFWDTADLAGKILAVLDYGPLREQLVRGGGAEVRAMDWESRGRALAALYRELLP
jgi:glycogen(starch) synthase